MKFSNITWREAESQIRTLAGTDTQKPPANLFREMSNIVLMYVWRVLDGKHDWAYRKEQPLTVKADVDALTLAQITALDVNVANALHYVTTVGNVLRTGDRVTMAGVSAATGDILGFTGVVSAGGVTAFLKDVEYIDPLSSGLIPAVVDWTHGARMVIVHSQAKYTADISALSLKKIVGVSETGSGRVWDVVRDVSKFRGVSKDMAYDDQIACYQRGDTLEIHMGEDATVIVDPVLEYDGIPELYTEATKLHEIELFQEYYAMWQDVMLGWTLDFIQKGKEPDLQGRIDTHFRMINDAMKVSEVDNGIKP